MARDTCIVDDTPRFPLPPLVVQADLAEKHGLKRCCFVLTPWHCVMSSSTRTQVRWHVRGAIGGLSLLWTAQSRSVAATRQGGCSNLISDAYKSWKDG